MERRTIRPSHGCVAITALVLAGCLGGVAADACALVTEGFIDVAADEYVLYGEVTGYASVKIGRCDDASLRDQCHDSWGLQLRSSSRCSSPTPRFAVSSCTSSG